MVSGLLTPGHVVILLVVVVLLFGPKRLPELGRALGSGMRGFKSSLDGHELEPVDERPPST
jgi:sec-independent protein translocase protein TatA